MNNEGFACHLCHKVFNTLGSCRRHIKHNCSLNRQVEWICRECKLKISSRENLKRHLRTAHPEVNLKECLDFANREPIESKEGGDQTVSGNEINVCGDQPTQSQNTNALNNNSLNTNCHNTINNITADTIIYFNRDPNFLDLLIKLTGSEEGAIRAIKKAVYHKTRGEIELLGDVYLRGDDPSKWSIMCVDPKTAFFKVKMSPDGDWISDPGGKLIREIFCGNYTDSILQAVGRFMINRVVDIDVDKEWYSHRVEGAMDHIDMKSLQDRAMEVCSQRYRHDLFTKELIKYYFERVRAIRAKLHDEKSEQIQKIDTILALIDRK